MRNAGTVTQGKNLEAETGLSKGEPVSFPPV